MWLLPSRVPARGVPLAPSGQTGAGQAASAAIAEVVGRGPRAAPRAARAGRGARADGCSVAVTGGPSSGVEDLAPVARSGGSPVRAAPWRRSRRGATTSEGETTSISARSHGTARAGLALVGRVVDAAAAARGPLEVLHGVRQVHALAVDAGLRQRLVEHPARRARRRGGPRGPRRRRAARPPASARPSAAPPRRRSGCRARGGGRPCTRPPAGAARRSVGRGGISAAAVSSMGAVLPLPAATRFGFVATEAAAQAARSRSASFSRARASRSSAWRSIWRTRSRVIPSLRPTSCSVSGWLSPSP